ncbi:MAG: VOC family protein [Lysobacterales bacterium]|jgi:PhnB protein|nr:MAG: VOC family protein [Xanthomonadales bacterium]
MNRSSTASFAVHEVYPYLRVRDAGRALDFYQRAFGAQELFRLTEPGGRIGHAEIKIGATTLMLSDEYPEMGVVGPQALGGTTFSIHLHVDDADAWIARAVEAGATIVRPATDAFYGERGGTVRDPFGHEWMLGHQIEEVSSEEMQRRYTALFASK